MKMFLNLKSITVISVITALSTLGACSPKLAYKGRPNIKTTTPGFNNTSEKPADANNNQDQSLGLSESNTQISPDFYGEWQIRGTQCGPESVDISQTHDGRITILGSQLVNNFIDYEDDEMICRLEETYDVKAGDANGATVKIVMTKLTQNCEAKDQSWSDPTEWELSDSDKAPRVIRLQDDGYGNLNMQHLSGDSRCGGNGTAIDIFTMNSAYI